MLPGTEAFYKANPEATHAALLRAHRAIERLEWEVASLRAGSAIVTNGGVITEVDVYRLNAEMYRHKAEAAVANADADSLRKELEKRNRNDGRANYFQQLAASKSRCAELEAELQQAQARNAYLERKVVETSLNAPTEPYDPDKDSDIHRNDNEGPQPAT